MMSAGRYDNHYMYQLRKETEHLGMTTEHLHLWRPREDVGAKCKKGPEFCFEEGHKKAVISLMKDRKLSAICAIQEVSYLAQDEASVLVDLYKLGINGQFICDHRHEYDFTSLDFSISLHKMVAKYKLPLDAALKEIKGLSVSERGVLLTYYGDGLRAQTLRSLRGDISPADFENNSEKMSVMIDSLHRLYLFLNVDYAPHERRNYLDAVIQIDLRKSKSWEEIILNAANEAYLIRNNNGRDSDSRRKISLETYPPITSQRMHFLNRHIKQGVRAQDVPEQFSKYHRDMYRVLRVVHRQTVQAALSAMARLNEEQVQLLRKYYTADVRGHDLLAYPHSAMQTVELIKYFRLLPRNGILDLATLNAMQFACLSRFANNGLTLQEAKQLQGEFNQLKKDVVVELVKHGFQAYSALQNVLPVSNEEAAKLPQESHSDFDHGMTIKL